jgi:hypothetical protein
MAARLFTCPAIGMNVQHWLDDEEEASEHEYEVFTCLACSRLHFINRKTGKLLGQNEE